MQFTADFDAAWGEEANGYGDCSADQTQTTDHPFAETFAPA